MSRLKTNNYYVVQGFMITKLGLKENELNTFAIIYGFSQAGEGEFKGSVPYIAEWLSVDERSVYRIIKSLVEKKLIIKESPTINGKECNRYRANTETIEKLKNGTDTTVTDTPDNISPVPLTKCHPSPDKMSPPYINNNKYIDSSNNNTHNNISCPVEEIFKMYQTICTNLKKHRLLNDRKRKAINARWNKEANKDIEIFREVFTNANNDPFMCGKGNRGWKADLDYLMSEKGFVRALELSINENEKDNSSGKGFYELWQERLKEVENGNTET